MLKTIKYELRRFVNLYIILLAGCLIFFLLDFNKHLLMLYQLHASIIEIITTGLALYLIIIYILDDYKNKKLLYQKASLTKTQEFLGKLFTMIILFGSYLFIMTFVYNLKLYILYKHHYLEYLRLNLDHTYLALIGRDFKEWLYPLHLCLKNTYIIVTLALMYGIFTKLREKRYDSYNCIVICFLISAIIYYLSNYLVKLLDETLPFLDFSYITPRLRAFGLEDYLVNILSVNSLAVVLLSFIIMIKFITKKRSDNQ